LLTILLLCYIIVLLTGINKGLFIYLNSLAAYFPSFIWANLTFMGDSLAACAIMLLFIRKRPDLVWAGIISTIIATLVVNLVKSFYNIPRPPAIIEMSMIKIIGPTLNAHSFPSGHTVTIFTLAGILIFNFKSFFVRLSFIFLAVLVGFSRIAVGAHWPADVLAGAALGILFAMTGIWSVTRLKWEKIKTMQLVIGFVLIVSNIYLLFFYDSKYPQAVYLQYILAMIVLGIGVREFYLVMKNR
jgi:membrane-associated phospholipid phosphatase